MRHDQDEIASLDAHGLPIAVPQSALELRRPYRQSCHALRG